MNQWVTNPLKKSNYLGLRPLNAVISGAIRQPLAYDAPHRANCTLLIVNTKLDAIVISEIKLSQISVQMPFAQCWYTPFMPRLKIEW